MRFLNIGGSHLFIACVVLCSLLTVAASQPVKQRGAAGGISQLIETRDGHRSCWGVIIQFNELTLKDTVQAAQLAITEAKHGSDLKQLMIWNIEDGGKRLVVNFKQGKGDFGSGNYLTVAIRGSAFLTEPVQVYVFQISTDVL